LHLTIDQRVDFLTRLRTARALVLRDAESFHEAATVLEYIGQVIQRGRGRGLGAYEEQIVALAISDGGAVDADIRRQFNVIREARNDIVHDGAYVRHLSDRLADFLVRLEDAVMCRLRRVGDVMVRNPVTAELWHLITHVRREMLANSFSNIPIYLPGAATPGWHFLTDRAVMRFLTSAPNAQERHDRLGSTIECAIANLAATELPPAQILCPDDLIVDVAPRLEHLPALVTDARDGSRLVGIISPFDLL